MGKSKSPPTNHVDQSNSSAEEKQNPQKSLKKVFVRAEKFMLSTSAHGFAHAANAKDSYASLFWVKKG